MRLYTFLISHYCEKARWALDYKGLSYEEVVLLPGPHVRRIRKLAPKSEVPVLEVEDTAVQGSGAIIDCLEERHTGARLTPPDPIEAEACRALEHQLDEEVGRAMRRVFYFHAFQHRRFLLSLLVARGPRWASAAYTVGFRPFRRLMTRRFGLNEDQIATDVETLEAAFGRLADQTRETGFLIGRQFTRADLTAAALTAHFCRPPEHTLPWPPLETYPPGLRTVMDRLSPGPFLTRMGEHYRERRRTHSPAREEDMNQAATRD